MLDKLKKLNLESAYTMIARFIFIPGFLALFIALVTNRIDSEWGLVLIGFLGISEHVIATWAAPKRGGHGAGAVVLLALGLAKVSESSVLSDFFSVMFILFSPLLVLEVGGWGGRRKERDASD